MKTETLLHEEIQSEFKALKEIEMGTDEYKIAVDGLAKLMDKAVDLDRLNIEHQEKMDAQEMEREMKLKQMEEDKKDRTVKNILTAAGIIIPTGVTIWGTLKSLKFEQDGTITTIMGRGFINKLLPKK